MANLIYSNDMARVFPNEEENLSMYREFLEINGIEEGELSLNAFLCDTLDIYFEDLKREVELHEKTKGKQNYLVLATIQTWDGKYDGGAVIEGMMNVISRCFEDYNDLELVGKRVHISASHHDGTNHFEVKELTERGYEYLENNKYKMTERELHQKLFNNSHYTREVRMFKEIYG